MAKTETKPETPTWPARRAAPGSRMTYHDRAAGEIHLDADEAGLVPIASDDEARVADDLGLPVAGPAPGEPKDGEP